MKKFIITTCLSGVLAAGLAAPSAAGNWATYAQGSRIINILYKVQRATEDTRDNVKEVQKQVKDSSEELGDRIIAALRSHSGEQSAYQDKQIEANRRITDAAQINDTNRMREEFRARAESGEFDPNPGMCLLSGLFRGAGSTSAAPRGSAAVIGARQQANGADVAVKSGGAALDRSIVDKRSTLSNAMDVTDATVDPAAILKNPTLSLDSDTDRQAAEQLVRNLTDPRPPRPVTADEMRTPEGVARAASRTVQEARNNASAEVISMVMNMRSEVGPAEPWKPYIEDISNYNRPVGDQLSELQAIDIRTLRHYAAKPEVFQERSSWSEKQLLQEILDAVSIGNRIAYIGLELDSRRAVVETQILSVLNNGQ